MSRIVGPNKGVNIRPGKKERIIAAYQWRCWICGARPPRLTMDHVVRRADGGRASRENLRPACGDCNQLRDKARTSQAKRARYLEKLRGAVHLFPPSISRFDPYLPKHGGWNAEWLAAKQGAEDLAARSAEHQSQSKTNRETRDARLRLSEKAKRETGERDQPCEIHPLPASTLSPTIRRLVARSRPHRRTQRTQHLA